MSKFPGISCFSAMLMLSLPFAVACNSSTGEWVGAAMDPKVLANTPLQDTTDVATNGYIGAIFSEGMADGDLNEMTFTLTDGTEKVRGTVIYSHSAVEFWPAAQLKSNTTFTATITEGAISASGLPLKADHTWSFTTGAQKAAAVAVNLGTAANYVILSKTGISTVPQSTITGNLGVSPAAATYITGFSLIADPTNVFSTSTQVTGKVYAANYANPTPSNLTTAISDMQTAYTSAAARAPDVIELGVGNIGGMTIPPGVYKWGTSVLIPTDITLSGSKTAVWIFQIAEDLTVADAVNVTLVGGALPKNVFWQVAGTVDLGTTAHFEGIVLGKTAVNLNTDASVKGRLFAQTAVTLNHSTVVKP